MQHIKIKEYRVQNQGTRGRVVSLPQVFLVDNLVKPGDKLEFFRAMIDNEDCLIIKVKKSHNELKQPKQKDIFQSTGNGLETDWKAVGNQLEKR